MYVFGNKIQKKELSQTDGEAMWSAFQTIFFEWICDSDSDPYESAQFAKNYTIS
jgi:hypothetical protein